MANHLAHYQVLKQGDALTISDTDNADSLTWDPADDIAFDVNGDNNPVLVYSVDADNAQGFGLTVEIPGRGSIIERFYSGGSSRQLMVPFPLKWVTKSKNVIQFRKTAGSGTVQVRNVVVLYVRKVLK